MAAPFVKAHQFMASDDLTAPNAVGVDQDKINSLDRRIVAQKAGGLIWAGCVFGEHIWHFGHFIKVDTTSSKAAIRRSICLMLVTGLTNIIL